MDGAAPAAGGAADDAGEMGREYLVVLVDGSEFPSMDGMIKQRLDPFVRISGGNETSTKFRVRARSGAANWNEAFRIAAPRGAEFAQVELRDHDLKVGKSRMMPGYKREKRTKQRKYSYASLRAAGGRSGGEQLAERLGTRAKESQVVGSGLLRLEEGIQTAIVFSNEKEVGRLNFQVREIDNGAADADGAGAVAVAAGNGAAGDGAAAPAAAAASKAYGPPSWAWLLLLAAAIYQPGSSFFFAVCAMIITALAIFVATRGAFKKFDKDGDGLIDAEEFHTLARTVLDKDMDEDAIHLIFLEIDSSGNGSVTPQELAQYFMRAFGEGAAKKLKSSQAKLGAGLFSKLVADFGDLETVQGKAVCAAVELLFLALVFSSYWWNALLA